MDVSALILSWIDFCEHSLRAESGQRRVKGGKEGLKKGELEDVHLEDAKDVVHPFDELEGDRLNGEETHVELRDGENVVGDALLVASAKENRVNSFDVLLHLVQQMLEFRSGRLMVVLKLFKEVDVLVERGGNDFGVLPDTAERVTEFVRRHVEEPG